MARIRSIKPEFWTDEKIIELSPTARLLFIGLWNFADDEGRMVLSPKRIRLQILPADDCDISALLGEIRRESLISLYTVDGVEYLQVNGFHKHQKIDKRSASRLPAPPESRRIPTTDQGMDQGREGIKDQGMDQGVDPKQSSANASSIAPEKPQKTAAPPIDSKPEPETQKRVKRAVEISAMLKPLGVEITGGDKFAQDWARDDVSDSTLKQAVEIARTPNRKPAPQLIPAKYLAAIVAELRAPEDLADDGRPDPRCIGLPDGENRCETAARFYPGRSKRGWCRECREREEKAVELVESFRERAR